MDKNSLIEDLMIYIGIGNFLASVIVLTLKSTPLYNLWFVKDKEKFLLNHVMSSICTGVAYIALEDKIEWKNLPLVLILGFCSELLLKTIKMGGNNVSNDTTKRQ